jgi:hypothetical protein
MHAEFYWENKGKDDICKTVSWNKLLQDFFCWRNFVEAAMGLGVVRFEVLITGVKFVVVWSVATCM